MRFSCLTLFPEIISASTEASIIGKAVQKGLFQIEMIQIRDFAVNEYGKVDDALFGGGTGMLMMAEPIWQAAEHARQRFRESGGQGKEKLIYLSPRGRVLNQKLAHRFLDYDHLLLLCGHYEGVDARVLEELQAEEISLGDYVMSGGELAAAVLIDVIARMIPGVLPGDEAWQNESHADGLLEENQYTRPAVWHGHEVPEVLLSGHAARIEEYRKAQKIIETLRRRPELCERAGLDEQAWQNAAKWLDREECKT